jgi:DNA repair exonuclease SbcCD ATPase subunit
VIRRVHLEHWRAYEDLDLPLTHPVTFVVAPNGVGKSSLVEAVRWALLGTPSDKSRGRAVRGGYDAASVTLDILLPEGQEIEVTRTLLRGGAVTFAATADGQNLTENDYLDVVTEAWSADVALLDAVIFGPTTGEKVTGFPIRDHLAAVYGVAPLLASAVELKLRRDAIAKQMRSLRDDIGGTTDAIEGALRDIAHMENLLSNTEDQRKEAAAQVAKLEVEAAQVSAWQRYRDEAVAYGSKMQALIASMGRTLSVTVDDPRASLAAAQQRVAADVETSRSAVADAQLLDARSAGAADLLAAATGQCPTCLRPLSAHERDTALRAHGNASGGAKHDIAHYERETARLGQELADIARLSADLAQLSPPAEPDHSDPGPGVATKLSEARQHADELAQARGALTARLDTAQRGLQLLREAATDQQQLARLAREDTLLDVTHRSVVEIAERYLNDRVEPLATQIGHRWKLLFGGTGLQLRADGRLQVGHAEIDLALSDLSGGERATALLVTRIMLAAAATQASTLWLDEPLEHLDPVRRAGVAATLVRAAQAGSVKQILVTTYEDGLARRLEATAPEVVKVTYVRSTSGDQV